jgi:hypothetical protein
VYRSAAARAKESTPFISKVHGIVLTFCRPTLVRRGPPDRFRPPCRLLCAIKCNRKRRPTKRKRYICDASIPKRPHLLAFLDTPNIPARSSCIRIDPGRNNSLSRPSIRVDIISCSTNTKTGRSGMLLLPAGSCRRLYSGRIDKLSAKQAAILGGSAWQILQPCRQPLAFCCSFIRCSFPWPFRRL